MEERGDFEKTLEEAMKSLDYMETISPDEFPTIDLYMDQVTTFMERKLRMLMRNPSGDKILTKTMINNYAKNDLIPPPIKKKYSREHMFALLFVFYFKSFLSISDIQTLLEPMMETYFDRKNDCGYSVEDIYGEILKMGRGARAELKEEMLEKYRKAEGAYENAPEETRDYLRKFAFICELGYDIFLKKNMIERMIDDMAEERMLEKERRELREEAERKAAKDAVKQKKESAGAAGKQKEK